MLRILANVQQATIKPIITAAIAPGTLVHTDEYSVYARLRAWGYGHETVCHTNSEYGRNEEGDSISRSMSHDRGLLVPTVLLAIPAPEHLAGQAAVQSQRLPIRAQRAPMRQSPGPCLHRQPGRVTDPSPREDQ
jgi:hypothetical protein